MKFFSSKSAHLLFKTFTIYLALSLILFLLPARWTGPARATLLYPFTWLQGAFLGGAAPAEGLVRRLADLWSASGDADRLRGENAALRARLVQETERRRTAELLLQQIAPLPPEVRSRAVPATLAGYDASPLRRTASFNKGSRSGVAVNGAVLWNGAVIGRVESVGPWSCRATLVGDRNCGMAVRCARTRVRGSLEGIGGGLAEVKYVDAAADVRPGDVFVTSGVDRLFPAGLLVGRCVESSTLTGDIFKYVLLQPAFDPGLLEHVAILLPEAEREGER